MIYMLVKMSTQVLKGCCHVWTTPFTQGLI